MCVHWYFVEHFAELSYRFFSKSKGRILDELRVSIKIYENSQHIFIFSKDLVIFRTKDCMFG